MKKYDVYIADYAKTEVLQMPIPMIPPTVTTSISNETFETYWNSSFLFIEKAGLKTLTLSGWLPNQIYNFARSKVLAPEIIELFEKAINNTEPIVVTIVSTDGQMYLNDTFAIESFEKTAIKNGNIDYSLALKQFREYKTNTTTDTYTVGWKQNSTGWYYYTDTSGNYYKDSWQLINNYWYYFDSQGYTKVSEWFQDGGKWYYFGSDGAMYFNGTCTLDGVEYTFNDNGSLVES